jgi:hypothetical protein
MTDEQWADIVEAWAKWVRGDAPRVQGRRFDGGFDSKWEDWVSPYELNKFKFDEWRIKPDVRVARMYASGYSVHIARKRQDDPEPSLCDGESWLGPWQEVPEGK